MVSCVVPIQNYASFTKTLVPLTVRLTVSSPHGSRTTIQYQCSAKKPFLVNASTCRQALVCTAALTATPLQWHTAEPAV